MEKSDFESSVNEMLEGIEKLVIGKDAAATFTAMAMTVVQILDAIDDREFSLDTAMMFKNMVARIADKNISSMTSVNRTLQ